MKSRLVYLLGASAYYICKLVLSHHVGCYILCLGNDDLLGVHRIAALVLHQVIADSLNVFVVLRHVVVCIL
jgi:hypothetical protein